MTNAISRALLGKIVDEVFGGAIEDASVIEEIYAVIKREEATTSAAEPVKPYGYVYESTVRYFDGRGPQRKVDFLYTKKHISEDDIEAFEITETAVYSALSAQVQDVARVATSIDTMRDAAKDLISKNGWQPNHRLSSHSVVGLMAEFGMQVYLGEIGCGYPNCGCCADAACEDAIEQHPDFAAAAKQEGGG